MSAVLLLSLWMSAVVSSPICDLDAILDSPICDLDAIHGLQVNKQCLAPMCIRELLNVVLTEFQTTALGSSPVSFGGKEAMH